MLRQSLESTNGVIVKLETGGFVSPQWHLSIQVADLEFRNRQQPG